MLLYPRVGFGHHLGTIGRKSTIKTEGKRNAENSQKRSVYAGFRRFPFPQPTLNHLVRERKILLFFIYSKSSELMLSLTLSVIGVDIVKYLKEKSSSKLLNCLLKLKIMFIDIESIHTPIIT